MNETATRKSVRDILFSWRATILPYLEEQAIHDQLNFSNGPYRPPSYAAIESTVLPIYQCPSTPVSPRMIQWGDTHWGVGNFGEVGATNYLSVLTVWAEAPRTQSDTYAWRMMAGAWSFFQYSEASEGEYRRSPPRLSKVEDGLSKTVLVMDRGMILCHGRPGIF